MGVRRRRFDNFFVIRGRRAVDLGARRPAASPSATATGFAIVRERRTGTNTASRVSGTRREVERRAQSIAELDRGRLLRVVIIGEGQRARIDGRILYRDRVGFEFVDNG